MKIPLSITARLVSEIDGRGDNRSGTIGKCLDRYLAILERSRMTMADLLSDGEIGLILDVLNGTDTISPAMVWAEVEDALPDGYAGKWNVDGPALVGKLKAMSYGECIALVDAVEVWWNRISHGEQIEPREALRRKPRESTLYPQAGGE